MKKLPFDLEKALQGHPLVTRDGREVAGFNESASGRDLGGYEFIAKIDGRFDEYYTSEGKCFITGMSRLDLFLAVPETPETAEPDYTCPRYRASVLLAFADGAEIEAIDYRFKGAVWFSVPRPSWSFDDLNYRVKPQPKAPRFCDALKCNDGDKWFDPWSEAYPFGTGGDNAGDDQEAIPMIELTPEVIDAIEAAGIPTKPTE